MAFTFFFRDQHVLDLAVQHLLPEIAGRSRPSIWDAGCAMGQEPYTLAILLAKQMGKFAFNNLRILATDIDESGQFGQIVGAGDYAREEVDRMPAGVRAFPINYWDGITADEASAAWTKLEANGLIVSNIDHGEITFAPVEVEPPA